MVAPLNHATHILGEMQRLRSLEILSERAIHLVGGNLEELDTGAILRATRLIATFAPKPASGFEESLSADYVGFEKQLGILDASIHVAFGCEIHDKIGI